jgi:hypothetical protein
MPSVNTSELSGAALDWAVAKCEPSIRLTQRIDSFKHYGGCVLAHGGVYSPSTDWAQAGPIIDKHKITLARGNDLYFPKGNERGEYYEELWLAHMGEFRAQGQTMLIAAMRCYVASKLGNVVDISQELLNV